MTTDDPRVALLETALQGRSVPQNLHDRAVFMLALVDDLEAERPVSAGNKLLTAAEQARTLLADLEERRRIVGGDADFWPWWSGQLAAQIEEFITLIGSGGG